MPAEPFAVVLEPAVEMRSQRAERDQRANLELDAEASRARAFIVMAAEALGHVPIPGPGTGRRYGEVNTQVTTAAGKLYALVEAGAVVRPARDPAAVPGDAVDA